MRANLSTFCSQYESVLRLLKQNTIDWLKLTLIFSKVWKLEVQDQSVRRIGFC